MGGTPAEVADATVRKPLGHATLRCPRFGIPHATCSWRANPPRWHATLLSRHAPLGTGTAVGASGARPAAGRHAARGIEVATDCALRVDAHGKEVSDKGGRRRRTRGPRHHNKLNIAQVGTPNKGGIVQVL